MSSEDSETVRDEPTDTIYEPTTLKEKFELESKSKPKEEIKPLKGDDIK